MNQKQNVFFILAAWMIGFGIVIGLIFPFFAWALGVSATIAMSPTFFIACVAAGILVGVVNILLARFTVGEKLKLFTSKMNHAKENILSISRGGDIDDCSIETCHIPVESDDQFGACGAAFNELIEAFAAVLKTQDAIRSYTEILSSQLELEVLAENALEVLMIHGDASAGSILLIDGERYQPIASHGIEDTESFQTNQVLRQVVKNKRYEMITYPKDLVVRSVLMQYQPRQVLLVPIVYKDKVLGIIVLATAETFSAELMKEIDIFAHSLALSLNNSLEHEELQRIAERDSLTDIYNRRAGLKIYREEYQRAMQMDAPFSALMIDIDYFKRVNDTYGHLIGDGVLKQVTGIAREVLRESDILIRYGGEEFFLALPNTEAAAAKQIAERLRMRIADQVMMVNGTSIQVSVSIGCGTLESLKLQSESEFIQMIDDALYQAKESGRNRVVIA